MTYIKTLITTLAKENCYEQNNKSFLCQLFTETPGRHLEIWVRGGECLWLGHWLSFFGWLPSWLHFFGRVPPLYVSTLWPNFATLLYSGDFLKMMRKKSRSSYRKTWKGKGFGGSKRKLIYNGETTEKRVEITGGMDQAQGISSTSVQYATSSENQTNEDKVVIRWTCCLNLNRLAVLMMMWRQIKRRSDSDSMLILRVYLQLKGWRYCMYMKVLYIYICM